MNPISAFFVENIVGVFFFYGLAFFVMGLALVFGVRRASRFRFAKAILPLAAFAFLHAAHEWYEMFQLFAAVRSGHTPGYVEEIVRVGILSTSFVMLLIFGLLLLGPRTPGWRRIGLPVFAILALWLLATAIVALRFQLAPLDRVYAADNLARYGIGIPAALMGARVLMAQQRTFREHDMPQFGRDLVWAAAALLLYGVVGQFFVRETVLAPSQLFNSANFLAWFGIPVQLFRAAAAAALTLFLVRALRAFEFESQRRLEQAHNDRLAAQTAALAAERRTTAQAEALNEELRMAAHKLSLLLDLSNLLDTPAPLADRLCDVLERVVHSLPFAEAGLILLAPRNSRETGDSVTGFGSEGGLGEVERAHAAELGHLCIARRIAICRHVDGQLIEFSIDTPPERHECRRYLSPTTAVAMPLTAHQQVIGSLVLARSPQQLSMLASEELALMAGVAQQLGLSVENALLHEQAQRREQMLGDLLGQVVGAQEAERQRIARELHDATGQALTAIGLGLRGAENALLQAESVTDAHHLVYQVREMRTFSQSALGELHNVITDLRPPQLDDLGLAAALRWYIQEYERRRSMSTRFVCEGDDDRLPPDYRTVLFRIAQEALTNIAKHAGAASAEVSLIVRAGEVQLKIHDDGRGFDALQVSRQAAEQPGGWGLVGIRERATLLGGRCEIETAPGCGTRLRITAPLAPNGVLTAQAKEVSQDE